MNAMIDMARVAAGVHTRAQVNVHFDVAPGTAEFVPLHRNKYALRSLHNARVLFPAAQNTVAATAARALGAR